MNELTLELTEVSPQVFCGEDESNIKYIKTLFPKLKIVARGSKLIVFGEELQLKDFQTQIEKLIAYCAKYNRLDERTIDSILSASTPETAEKVREEDIIVHGVSGKIIRPQTQNQVKLVEMMRNNDMVFAVGPAGTGKTYVGVALAVKALKEKQVRRIILTRPAVEAGENLGFLPGDLKEKLDPYMQPLYDALRDMIPHEKLNAFIEAGIIEIAPLAFMRGRTLDNAFVILDEAQNTTHAQMKMFLTRMGRNAKFMITGDPGQIDLPRKVSSGLKEAMLILQNVQGIAFLHLDDKDVVRHPLVRSIIEAYKTIENNE
ncbi:MULTISPECIES: PhoH family protein [Capnocytophaga]|jgi:phoH family protein|uniref:PhoH-like protein n=2 Tax=Capnocytophaga TaxID=1016 RepID=A0ABS1YZM2_9FLAO|nr:MULTISPECIES: PhoH family protein [Capnocytophaga]EKY12640.1 PhoH family protein [Capnocytophaga sp. oral taxon 326 str. F0382]MBI1647878.1 PhoH family protein [Capnocytophaga periodontitidis]MBI1669169.1 PhoH family protein [Capnocytophaga periodontitidis]MBM0651864.1 PhoH family protein [Capnocytophaga genosp. AHN8471]MBM0652754.1 PhoH family protein [Capnocytophaga genosp. AHN8471]